MFIKHKVQPNFTPDYLIINFSIISKNFEIFTDEYIEVYSTENYKIYTRK